MMAWSTKELADLSNTSVRIIRHYHDIGLLDEPPRLTNGYKQYGTADLVRVLRIHRLSRLGFSLQQIAGMLDVPADTDAVLDQLDSEIAATIVGLEQVRRDIARTRSLGAPVDMTPEAFLMMEAFGQDANLAIVVGQMFAPPEAAALAEVLREVPAELAYLNDRFLALAADADESEIARMTEDMIESLSQFSPESLNREENIASDTAARRKKAKAFFETVSENLNSAQARVFSHLVSRLATGSDE